MSKSKSKSFVIWNYIFETETMRQFKLWFGYLSNSQYYDIISHLKENPSQTVTQLYIHFRIEHQPVMSQLLAKLRQMGVLQTERVGKHIKYSVNETSLKAYIDFAKNYFDVKGCEGIELFKYAKFDFRALETPARIDILNFIQNEQRVNVNKIYSALNTEQSITSQNLRILRLQGFIEVEKLGKFRYYTIAQNEFEEFGRSFEELKQSIDIEI